VDIQSGFSIVENRGHSDMGTDVVREGVLHNFTLERRTAISLGEVAGRKIPFFYRFLLNHLANPETLYLIVTHPLVCVHLPCI
jgi:hypothetical protein